jgi:dipeptidyl aminopeptidase/acylaminoacyl peptidase
MDRQGARVVGAGLGLAALVLIPVVGALAASGGPPAPGDRPAIVAVSPVAATATFTDGSSRVELPWLLPGDDDVAVAPDGNRVAFSSERDGNRELYVADAATGQVVRLTRNLKAEDRRPAWSPNGRRLAWQSGRVAAADLFVMDADGGRKQRLAGGAGDDVDPAWSPDGKRVAFSSNRGGHRDLWSVPAAGGEPELLLDVRGEARAPAWSPDGRRLAYAGVVGGNSDVWVVAAGGTKPRRVTRGAASDLRPDWAPDGPWLAFTRAAGGRVRTWLVRADGTQARPLEGAAGDTDPDWAVASPSLAPGADQLLPDLEQLAPAGLVVIPKGKRFKLGFASAVENLGRGALRIRGVRPPGRATMDAKQVIELRGGGTRIVAGVGRMKYEDHPPHKHWHFQPFERYELRRASDNAFLVRDGKSGFCLIDRYGRASRFVKNVGPPRFISDCGALRPEARRVEEGSSAGYVDRYPAFFHGQDVDVTGLPAGEYLLVHIANPERLVRELAYSNNQASLRIRLTWPSGPARAPKVDVLARCGDTATCP